MNEVMGITQLLKGGSEPDAVVPERSRWAKVARPVLKERCAIAMWTSTLTRRGIVTLGDLKLLQMLWHFCQVQEMDLSMAWSSGLMKK